MHLAETGLCAHGEQESADPERRDRDRRPAADQHRRRLPRQRRADRRVRPAAGARGRAPAARRGGRPPGPRRPARRLHAGLRRTRRQRLHRAHPLKEAHGHRQGRAGHRSGTGHRPRDRGRARPPGRRRRRSSPTATAHTAEATAELVREAGASAHALVCDLRVRDQIEAMVVRRGDPVRRPRRARQQRGHHRDGARRPRALPGRRAARGRVGRGLRGQPQGRVAGHAVRRPAPAALAPRAEHRQRGLGLRPHGHPRRRPPTASPRRPSSSSRS